MKNATLRYESYVNAGIYSSYADLLTMMQEDAKGWFDAFTKASHEIEVDEKDSIFADRSCERILKQTALVRTIQCEYLQRASRG